jgi:hypothetical protein
MGAMGLLLPFIVLNIQHRTQKTNIKQEQIQYEWHEGNSLLQAEDSEFKACIR